MCVACKKEVVHGIVWISLGQLRQGLLDFRKRFALDAAHVLAQRVRQELLALMRPREECAGPRLQLLVEEMQVEHALLPSLSPGKAVSYAEFLELLPRVSEREAQWHVSDLKVDGCELQHQQALWLHDPKKAKSLGLPPPRNLPSKPVITAPLRTGPNARPGAACGACGHAPAAAARRQVCRRHGWPQRCREDEMPPLMERKVRRVDLWAAYADFAQPRKLKAKAKVEQSWFRFVR